MLWRQNPQHRPKVMDLQPPGLRSAVCTRFGGWYGALERIGVWPTLEQVHTLRKQGLSITKIARQFIMTPQAVWKMLKGPRLRKRVKPDMPRGPAHPQWKGRYYTLGYVVIRHPVDGRPIREHRYVMEQLLERPLKSHEIVHHLNGVRDDNRLENLVILDSHRTHAYETRSFIVALQRRIRTLEESLTVRSP